MTNPTAATAPTDGRLTSLDAFRGAIMLLMASSGFGVPQIAREFPESKFWQILGHQFEHAEWVGCTLWDLIQPAFMFMVGVALPWSIANRRARGQSFSVMFGHSLWRSAALILLAVFLTSAWSEHTEWVFPNVLAQIGWGYPVLFLLAFAKPRVQWFAAFGILVLCWLAFALHPVAPANFDWSGVGVSADWSHLTGFAAHWDKNYNFAATFDQWFLNLFPREEPFVFNGGGYQTLNFVPSIATMLFGAICGRILREPGAVPAKLKTLLKLGIAGVALGLFIGALGLCPIVKRIWTPSWAIFSGGLVVLLLAGFVAVIEWQGWKRWAFPLVVAGLNPITLYCLWQLTGGFIRQSIRTHFGQDIFASFGMIYEPALERTATLFVYWLILYWMYRRKIFLRI